jgi:hypothetical protein
MGARYRGQGVMQAGTRAPEHAVSGLLVSCHTSGTGTRLQGQGNRPPYSDMNNGTTGQDIKSPPQWTARAGPCLSKDDSKYKIKPVRTKKPPALACQPRQRQQSKGNGARREGGMN